MPTTKGARKNNTKKESRERVIDAARKLFGTTGFHATTTAELTAASEVSIAQIYRIFASKDDIVIAIVEQRMSLMVAEMHAIFDAVRGGDLSTFDGIKAMAASLLNDQEVGLVFEILAESYRNPTVAEHVTRLATFYRDEIRRLAEFAKPDSAPAELDAYADVMLACLIGLYYRPVIGTKDAETSYNVACVMMRALGLAEEPRFKRA
jgi:TetR/AcrR family transcriptional regulator, repressor for uid operon